jgi:hypothetical protein
MPLTPNLARSSSSTNALVARNEYFVRPALLRLPIVQFRRLQFGQTSRQTGVSQKRGDEWFPLSQAVVAYDHARHAPLGDVITLDFINTSLEPGARAGIELTLETAKELRAALDRAIAAAEFEEAEVRGKGAVPSLLQAVSHAR